MAKGRKKKPENLKIIQGTFRDDRANHSAPPPDPNVARSPSWIPPEAREYFGILKERLDGLGMASRTYTEMMALAAMRLAEIDQLNDILSKEGFSYTAIAKNGSEHVKNHPAVGQRSDAMRHLQSLLSEFGLSPAAIQRVGQPKKDAPENPYGRFKKNG